MNGNQNFASALFKHIDDTKLTSNKFIYNPPVKDTTKIKVYGNMNPDKAGSLIVHVYGLNYSLGGVDGPIFTIGEEVMTFTLNTGTLTAEETADAATDLPYFELDFNNTDLTQGKATGLVLTGTEADLKKRSYATDAAFTNFTRNASFERYPALFFTAGKNTIYNIDGKYEDQLDADISAKSGGYLKTCGAVYSHPVFVEYVPPTTA